MVHKRSESLGTLLSALTAGHLTSSASASRNSRCGARASGGCAEQARPARRSIASRGNRRRQGIGENSWSALIAVGNALTPRHANRKSRFRARGPSIIWRDRSRERASRYPVIIDHGDNQTMGPTRYRSRSCLRKSATGAPEGRWPGSRRTSPRIANQYPPLASRRDRRASAR